ncbi:hypothetical protein P3339_17370 [Microbulbifer sp. MLAF003]|uniref:hypothetical protein n=1 Tax=Microbulbifer sp. MLAF003 TaxID=3032582 RepID=UPI0024AE4B9F|nr:hypothetical protein [Microbulbifer sp. MLAF003]WHI50201.1 hypothetical protein P3339_17370 [Microbulbifer sp. MLAF003]
MNYIDMLKEYLNLRLIGAFLLISVFVVMHIGYYDTVLLIPFIISIPLLGYKMVPKDRVETWPHKLLYFIWASLGMFLGRHIDTHALSFIKSVFDDIFIVSLLCLGVFLIYYANTIKKLSEKNEA